MLVAGGWWPDVHGLAHHRGLAIDDRRLTTDHRPLTGVFFESSFDVVALFK
jgi:hypothetical protein